MSNITFKIDGEEVKGKVGQTIMEAADAAGIYIPRLCARKGLKPFGSCRVCTVMVDGRAQSACTQPLAEGIAVENNTEGVKQIRKDIIEMLFVEGNHYCMFCEKSGNCELQAMAYRLGVLAPKYPYLFPKRELDVSHSNIFVDHDRCILCGRCIRTSKEIDGKNVLGFVERGNKKKISADAEIGLSGTDASEADEMVDACPVGALLKKRVGFTVPIGERLYDHMPIGSEIENNHA